jgi:hypothetical protein
MQLFLVTTLTAAILIVLPIVGSGMRAMDHIAAPPHVTIVHKNLSSPTLEELGQKAGDPAQAGVPENARDFGSPRTEQWI